MRASSFMPRKVAVFGTFGTTAVSCVSRLGCLFSFLVSSMCCMHIIPILVLFHGMLSVVTDCCASSQFRFYVDHLLTGLMLLQAPRTCRKKKKGAVFCCTAFVAISVRTSNTLLRCSSLASSQGQCLFSVVSVRAKGGVRPQM